MSAMGEIMTQNTHSEMTGQTASPDTAFSIRKLLSFFIALIFTLPLPALYWIQLELSCYPLSELYTRLSARPGYMAILNYLLLLFPIVMLFWLTRRLVLSCGIMTACIGLLSLVNTFVYRFHGSPLFVSELRNAGTALDVLRSYHLDFDTEPRLITLLFLIGIFCCLLIHRFCQGSIHLSGKKITAWYLFWIIPLTGMYMFFWLCFFTQTFVTWSVEAGLENAGYFPCLVEDFMKSMSPFDTPEGYQAFTADNLEQMTGLSEEILQPILEVSEGSSHQTAGQSDGGSDASSDSSKFNADSAAEQAIHQTASASDTVSDYPDIILILNESFYDLNAYFPVEADTDYLDDIHGLSNALTGFAAVPNVGGCTNNSEYELLTSNSMYLLNSSAPFNYMDLTKGSSLVRYLKSLGYETWAMHDRSPNNYSRKTGYAALGFDHLLFSEDFQHKGSYGKRPVTDEANYQDLYETWETGGDGPRFLYMLTYQNHGGYDQNDPSMATVHSGAAPDGMTSEINEYLTSISMSDDALAGLIDKFRDSERKTVICMVGDHAPSFITQLPRPEGLDDIEDTVRKLCTPYVIWSNFPMEIDDKMQESVTRLPVSLVNLAPLMLQSAGIPLSPYYQKLNQLLATVPVRTQYGYYIDTEWNIGRFDEHLSEYQNVMQYYYMEYHNLNVGKDYIESLFLP